MVLFPRIVLAGQSFLRFIFTVGSLKVNCHPTLLKGFSWEEGKRGHAIYAVWNASSKFAYLFRMQLNKSIKYSVFFSLVTSLKEWQYHQPTVLTMVILNYALNDKITVLKANLSAYFTLTLQCAFPHIEQSMSALFRTGIPHGVPLVLTSSVRTGQIHFLATIVRGTCHLVLPVVEP